jgi:hypothetical protein
MRIWYRELTELNGSHLETLRLEARDDGANKAALHAVGLDCCIDISSCIDTCIDRGIGVGGGVGEVYV